MIAGGYCRQNNRRKYSNIPESFSHEQCQNRSSVKLFHVIHQLVPFKKDAVYHLVIIVMSMEKRLLAKYHAGKHAAQTPHVQ